MKVRLRSGTKWSEKWLDSNTDYVVLCISSLTGEDAKYLLWSNAQETPSLYPTKDFEVTDEKLSSRWSVIADEKGYLYLGPRIWEAGDFWDRYHDGDPSAEMLFHQEKSVMDGE